MKKEKLDWNLAKGDVNVFFEFTLCFALLTPSALLVFVLASYLF